MLGGSCGADESVTTVDWTAEAWKQIRAGVSLVVWSRLATWDSASLRFTAIEEKHYEAAASQIHRTYGRLISWLIFEGRPPSPWQQARTKDIDGGIATSSSITP